MKTMINRIARGLFCLLCTGAGALIPEVGGNRADAQVFRYHYGDGAASRYEAGYGGVQPVSSGGYIAAGTTETASGGTDRDIYVVRTNNDGTLAWSKGYDIGHNEAATDIRECANGDFIVTGYTDTSETCCSRSSIFLMRLNPTGTVLWAKLYGRPVGVAQGWSVLETQYSAGRRTSAGDFVIAGTRANPGFSHAFIIRTNSSGTMIWNRLYNVPNNQISGFKAITEAAVGAGAGDLIATGYVANGTPVDSNVLIARVSGENGGLGGGNRGMIVYGATTASEHGENVWELSVGPEAGNIVVTGDRAVYSGTQHWFVVKTGPSPTAGPIIDQWYLSATGDEFAKWIREVTVFGMKVPRGTLAVTGSSVFDGYRFEAFIMQLDPATLAPAPSDPLMMRFAEGQGQLSTQGYSLSQVAESPGQRTAGYILAGSVHSITAGSDLYLVKTDSIPTSVYECIHQEVPVDHDIVNAPWSAVTPSLDSVLTHGPISTTMDSVTYARLLCYDPHGTCDGCILKSNMDDGAEGALSSGTGALQMLRSYPNPVTTGSALNLEYHLAGKSTVSLTITDIAGTIVHTASAEYAAGDIAIAVKTEGWRPSVYVVKAAAGHDVMMSKIVVTD